MLDPGTVVDGRYRLVRQIGEGGMATIWAAEHLTLGSLVAVKFLQARGPKEKRILERFLREARVAASVRHRNVIEIVDFGVANEMPYMVMELLRGESLADKLDREGIIETEVMLRIAALTLRGLHAVHEARIVHRDLKPENVFLVEDADGVFPKLLDFGVSRLVRDTNSSLTQEGTIVGTPEYMSPEQARGLKGIDERTDLYSLGAMLYEGLSGRLPFDAPNLGDLIMLITTDEPVPLRNLRPDLPRALIQLVERAMSKRREDRFQSAREMRAAILDVVKNLEARSRVPKREGSDFPAQPAALPRPERQRVPARITSTKRVRPPRLVIAATAAAIVGIGGVGGSLYFVPALSREAPSTSQDTWDATSDRPYRLLRNGAEWLGSFGRVMEPPEQPKQVVLHLTGLPQRALVRVNGVRMAAKSPLSLPQSEGNYEVEVSARGTSTWKTSHPGQVDGEYLVWLDKPAISKRAQGNTGSRRATVRRRRIRRRR